MMGGTLGKAHLWLTFVGFHLTFLVQHWLGAKGRPRRYADYLPTDGFTTLNMISSIGALRSGPPRRRSSVAYSAAQRAGGRGGRPVGLPRLTKVGPRAAHRSRDHAMAIARYLQHLHLRPSPLVSKPRP
jgi:hypothetical protein